MLQKANKRGFTLMEVLITVALVGILAAISIPLLGGALESARADSCSAKCQSMAAAANAAAATMTESELPPGDNDPLDSGSLRANNPLEGGSAYMGEYLNDTPAMERSKRALNTLGDYTKICPDGGDISIYPDLEGNIQLVCSKHGKGKARYYDPVAYIKDGFQKLRDDGKKISSKTDSTSTFGPNIQAMFPFLPSFGTHNIATWSVKNSGGNEYKRNIEYIVWSDVDIRSLSVGARVPVMRYNEANKSYEVWTMAVVECHDNNEDYLVLDHTKNMSQYTDSKAAKLEDKSFDNALKWYDKLKAESGVGK